MFEILHFQIMVLPFLAGAAIAFFGWTLYWLSINITGGALGGTVGVALGAASAFLFGRDVLFLPLVFAMGGLGLILGIFLIRKIHILVFFLTGFALGVLAGEPIVILLAGLGIAAMGNLGLEIVVKILTGIVGGILLMRFNRYIVSVLTAAVGSMILMSSWNFRGGVLPALPIFIAALFVQITLIRRRKLPRLSHENQE